MKSGRMQKILTARCNRLEPWRCWVPGGPKTTRNTARVPKSHYFPPSPITLALSEPLSKPLGITSLITSGDGQVTNTQLTQLPEQGRWNSAQAREASLCGAGIPLQRLARIGSSDGAAGHAPSVITTAPKRLVGRWRV